MAITGIDTIEGKQIIAAGAVSAKSAEMAYNDENGNPITGYQVAGDYYSASNPSGFITGVDLTPYQLTADMTAYQSAGEYYSASNPSGFLVADDITGKLDASVYAADSANFLTAVPAGTMNESAFGYDANDKISGYNGSAFAGGSDVPEGVMVESGLEYNAVNEISGYNGSAIAQYGAEKQWLQHDDTIVHVSNSAQYAFGVNLSAVAQLLGIDETVLFETTSGGALSGSFTENLTNFNYIEFFCNRVNSTANSNLAGSLKIAMVGEGVPSEIMLQAGLHTNSTAMFDTREYFNLTNTGFAWDAGYNANITKIGTTGTNIIALDFKNFGITKVIGIGRKA